MQEANK